MANIINSTYMMGVKLEEIYFNGVNLDTVYFNGALVFTKKLVIVLTPASVNDGGYINLKKLIDLNRHHNESEVEFTIAKGVELPAIKTGGMLTSGVKKASLINKGTISAIVASGTALTVTEKLILDNTGGTIRGAGGDGGRGGAGGKGHTGANKRVSHKHSTPHSQAVHEKRGANGHHNAYWEGIPKNGVNPCDYVYWDNKRGKHCSGKTGHISGLSGTFTRGPFAGHMHENGYDWNVYDIIRNYTKHTTTVSTTYTTVKGGSGGNGGGGGAGGNGQYFKHTKTNGSTGSGGHGGSRVSGGNTGYTGGKGGTGGNGGTWGVAGGKGSGGATGGGHGSKGAGGEDGGRAGYSIDGFAARVTVIAKGTLTGPTHG